MIKYRIDVKNDGRCAIFLGDDTTWALYVAASEFLAREWVAKRIKALEGNKVSRSIYIDSSEEINGLN